MSRCRTTAAVIALVAGAVMVAGAPPSVASAGPGGHLLVPAAPPPGPPALSGSGPAVIHVGEFIEGHDSVVFRGENLQTDPPIEIKIDDGAPPGITEAAPPEITPTSITLHLQGTAAATGLHAVTVTDPTSGLSATLAGAFVVRPFGGELFTTFPHRVVDTRDGTGFVPVGKLAPGSVTVVSTQPFIGPPSQTDVEVLNVTVSEPTGPGYVTIHRADEPSPGTSDVNFVAGQLVSNLVTVSDGGGNGPIAIEMHGAAAHVVIDSVAFYSQHGVIPAHGGVFVAQPPARVLDTRASGAPLGGGATLRVPVAAPGSHVSTVAVNVTVDRPTASGYVTAFPSGLDNPGTSTVNFSAGETVGNMAIVGVGEDGAIDLFNYAGSTHVIVDVLGTYDDGTLPIAGGQYQVVPHSRLLDTRLTGTPVVPSQPLELPIVGRGGVPAVGVTEAPTAAVFNVTATEPTAATYLSVAPSDAVPGTSNLNVVAGQTRANLVVSALSGRGGVSIRSFAGSTQVLADIQGYFS